MLPPGIYLWESGQADLVSETDVDRIRSIHDSWALDIESCGQWVPYDFDEMSGRVLKSMLPSVTSTVIVESCTSTMEVARYLSDKGVLGPWDNVVAVKQVSGRGQLRRAWMSPPGNLHMSVVLPDLPAEGEWRDAMTDLRPLVAGYVFCEVLSGIGARSVELKWPNDILQGNSKVGGLLIEEGKGRSILGAGFNLAEFPPDSMMREDSSVSAGRLQIPTGLNTPLSLSEILVGRGKNVYETVLDEFQPAQFVSAVVLRLAWLGKPVLVREGDQSAYEAVVTGLSPRGGLVIRCSGKESVLYSGSILPL